ncbi:hypothetical protein LXL04_002105 [Taraxacum kok-saghyz]
MEIGLNKHENTKTSEFVSFSIREYVAKMRKKDPKRCWPFGSLGNPDMYDVLTSYHQSVESSFLCSQNCPRDHIDSSDNKPESKEASNSFNKDTFNGKDDRDMIESLAINDNMCKTIINNGYLDSNSTNVIICKTQNQSEGSGDNGIVEPGRNDQPRRKHHKIRLLSDILNDLDKINTTKTEDDELDDMIITLDSFKVTTTSNKKMKTNSADESNFEKDAHGNDSDMRPLSKIKIDDMDFETIGKRKKVIRDTETANEDSEMEAVMLLAMHFNEENPSRKTQIVQSSLEESKRSITTTAQFGEDEGFAIGTNCACVQKKIRPLKFYTPKSSKTATQNPKIYLQCSVNRNPADFSIPNAGNLFMRGG